MRNAHNIVKRLFGPDCRGSFHRLECLLLESDNLDTATFWHVFQAVWPSCDGTWSYRYDTLRLLRRHQPFNAHLSIANRAAYQGLSATVQLFRGVGDRRHARGISWTTDRSTAVQFALGHRGRPSPDPVVATTFIRRDEALAINSARDECEVLVDFELLPRLTLEPHP